MSKDVKRENNSVCTGNKWVHFMGNRKVSQRKKETDDKLIKMRPQVPN